MFISMFSMFSMFSMLQKQFNVRYSYRYVRPSECRPCCVEWLGIVMYGSEVLGCMKSNTPCLQLIEFGLARRAITYRQRGVGQ